MEAETTKVSPHLGEGVHLPIVSVTSSRIETPVGSGRKVWILILQRIEKMWDRRSFCFSSIVVQTASFRACAILRFRDFFGNSRLSQILQVAERSNSGKHWVQDLCPSDNEKMLGASSRKMNQDKDRELGIGNGSESRCWEAAWDAEKQRKGSQVNLPNTKCANPNTKYTKHQGANTANAKYKYSKYEIRLGETVSGWGEEGSQVARRLPGHTLSRFPRLVQKRRQIHEIQIQIQKYRERKKIFRGIQKFYSLINSGIIQEFVLQVSCWRNWGFRILDSGNESDGSW